MLMQLTVPVKMAAPGQGQGVQDPAAAAQAETGTGMAGEASESLSFPSLLSQQQKATESDGESAAVSDDKEMIAAQLVGLMAIATARIEAPALAEAKAALTNQGQLQDAGEAPATPKQPVAKTDVAALVSTVAIGSTGSGEAKAPTAAVAGELPTGEDAQAMRSTGFRLEVPQVPASQIVDGKVTGAETAAQAMQHAEKPAESAGANPIIAQPTEPTASAMTAAQPLAWKAAMPAPETPAAAGSPARPAQEVPLEQANKADMPLPNGMIPVASTGSETETGKKPAADQAADPVTESAPAAVAHATAAPAQPVTDAAPQKEVHAQDEEAPLHGRTANTAPMRETHAFESTLAKSSGATAKPQAAGHHAMQSSQAASVRAQVIQQVASHARPAGGTETVTLQLDPEHLGRVEIQFSGRDDQLQVVITASGQDAERALREGARDLAHGIVERSGRWQHVDVRVELKDSGERRQERDSSGGDPQQEQENGHGGPHDQSGQHSHRSDEHAAREWAETGTGE